MARLYSNENFPLPVVLALRALGHDVETTLDVGKSDRAIPDEEVLEYAISERRAVITLNRKHFIRLHRDNPLHFGIIVCTLDPDFSGQANRIHEVLHRLSSLEGRLVRVNRDDANVAN